MSGATREGRRGSCGPGLEPLSPGRAGLRMAKMSFRGRWGLSSMLGSRSGPLVGRSGRIGDLQWFRLIVLASAARLRHDDAWRDSAAPAGNALRLRTRSPTATPRQRDHPCRRNRGAAVAAVKPGVRSATSALILRERSQARNRVGIAAATCARICGTPNPERAQAVQRFDSITPSHGVLPKSISVPREQLAVGV